MFKKCIYLTLFVCVCVGAAGVNALAGTITTYSEAPTLGPGYIAQLNGPISDTQNIDGAGITFSGDNDASTYVADDRSTQGQLFTTGSNSKGYTLEAIWVQNVMYTEHLNNGTYASFDDGSSITVRIVDPTKANTQGFVLHSEVATVANGSGFSASGSDGTGLWLYIKLDTPVNLAPNKQYGFDLTSYGPHFEMAGMDTDEYNEGSAYTTANKEDLNTGTLHTGDRVFVIPFEAQQVSAFKPKPINEDPDVPRDVVLSWKPGIYANTHNLYISTDFNDVNDATSTNPLNADFFEGIDVNNYDIGRLAFDTTYYWRIDEVNDPLKPGEYKGSVWSFTVEPVAYKVPSEDIKAKASNSQAGNDPNRTIDESGLNPDNMDLHSNIGTDMWVGVKNDANAVWIRYDFTKVYKLYQMMVWNMNTLFAASSGFKDVNVEYSLDGQSWTKLPDVPQFAQGTKANTYHYNTVVDFNGVAAKYVRLTALTNWGGLNYGLSEVRFTYIPVWAREPKPANEADGVPINATLSWRLGRDAVQHKVYLSTNEQMVEDGNAPFDTVSENSYSPNLILGKTYYWRVDEVNIAEPYPVWQGSVWSFTAQESLLVDDFEDYNSAPPYTYTVYSTWIDSIPPTGNTANGGSQMGLNDELNGTFCETTIVHGGRQSAPLYYNNTASMFSQVVANTSNLPIGSNWAAGNADTLVIWFRGVETNAATDRMYVKLNTTKVTYDGDVSDIARTVWTKWEINLSSLTGLNINNITSITIGVERVGGSGGSGLIYLDDIGLIIGIAPVDPGTEGLVAQYLMENNVQDSSGNSYNGVANGGPTYAAGRGAGMALVLDGTDDYVSLPIGSLISTLTNCTISAWVNWSGEGDNFQRIFDFGTGQTVNMWLATSTGSQIRFAITTTGSNGEDRASASPPLEANNWQLVTVVIDAGEPNSLSLYLNGDLVAQNSGANVNRLPMDLGVTTQNWLGRSEYTADPYYNGMLDDFRIYNKALSAAEVKYLYKN